MTKTKYIVILVLIASAFLNVYPFGTLNTIARGFPFIIMQLLWLLYGYMKRWPQEDEILSENIALSKDNRFTWLILISILPSMYMAGVLFHQSFIQDIISYRYFSIYLTIPILLYIKPSEKEVTDALYYFGVILITVSIVGTYIFPSILQLTGRFENLLDRTLSNKNDDFLIIPPSATYWVLLIPLYYYCYKLWSGYDKQYLLRALFLYAIFVAFQNRSSLFPATIFVAITFMKIKFNNRFIKPFITIILGGIAVYLSFDIIQGLIEQTEREMNSDYDPRIIATNYFLDTRGRSIWELLFGTGNISFVTSDYVKILQHRHIHYSDVGFIGFWHQFGILPILIFSYYLLKCLLSKEQPWNSRFLALHIIICATTISYFAMTAHIMWFVFFYYQYCYYKAESNPFEIEETNKDYIEEQNIFVDSKID